MRKHTSHESYVKIVLLSFQNVNHTGWSSGHFCLKGLFPQQVEKFMSEVKMSVWALVKDSAPLTVPEPDLRHKREECDCLTLSAWPSSPFPLTPYTQQQPPIGLSGQVAVSPATSSQFANMSLIWPACRTQMSQWWKINLRAKRCQAGDSCELHFHQMSAVANLH